VVKQKIDEFGIVTLVTGPRACGDGGQLDPVAAHFDALRCDGIRAAVATAPGSAEGLRERSI
jgi:hypothetical protein